MNACTASNEASKQTMRLIAYRHISSHSFMREYSMLRELGFR
jgi:hypothetical protein